MSVRILTGDCRDVLGTLADESVHCVVTSPPYFGLRDYGVAGQIGLEPTPDAYVAELVAVFREVRRVLRSDGVFWLNLGDSYNSNSDMTRNDVKAAAGLREQPRKVRAVMSCLKPKDLIGIPWMVAFALRADGWWLRQDVIWSKPNPMPESVTDRCTKAHEYLFLLTKSARYYYDAEAIAEPVALSQEGRVRSDVIGGKSWQGRQQHSKGGIYETRPRGNRTDGSPLAVAREPGERARGNGEGGAPLSTGSEMARPDDRTISRNRRSVWTVATQPFSEAHFATFPPALIEPCILAGCPAKCCAKCGAPWAREVERTTTFQGGSGRAGRTAEEVNASGKWAGQQYGTNIKLGPVVSTKALGFSPSCKCDADTAPGTVLDPFGGAGTTALVADRLQRDAVLIELNPDYAAMAERRTRGDAPLFAAAE